MRRTQERSFCAASVPSIRSRGVRQLSHAPHSLECLAVGAPVGLAEILEELDAAAQRALAELDELREVLAGDRLLLLIRDTVDEAVQPHGVGWAVEEHAFARQAVSAGAARFLVITLDVLGQVMVQDEPDVGLVDAHAERDGRDDDLDLVLDEEVLSPGAFRRIESGVVGCAAIPSSGSVPPRAPRCACGSCSR